MRGDQELPEDWRALIERHAQGSPALQKLFPEFGVKLDPEDEEREPPEERG
jgi:hypothetical protein